jgi:hypothetical protein
MRSVFTLAALVAVASAGVAEELKNITLPTRYGISPNAEFYPQGTAKEAVDTAAALLEKGRYAYLLAHVMDPAFVDAQVAVRVERLLPAVEKRLREVRADQRRSLAADTAPEDVLPADPAAFAEKVRAEAEKQAFADLVRSMQENLAEFPENVAQFAAVSREGTISENAPEAVAEAKSLPTKKVYLKQLGVAATRESRVVVDNVPTTRSDPTTVQRWFVEDRQQADKKADDKAKPGK